MSTAAAVATEAAADGADAAAPKKSGKSKLIIMIAVPLLLAGAGAGLWFSGILPKLLGMQKPPAEAADSGPPPPVFVEVPEIISNLNAGLHKTSYVKLKARIELAKADDATALNAALPRIQDLFQTYLREMRPDELRGAAGTYRLREELIARAAIAAAPAHVNDILFTELLVQ